MTARRFARGMSHRLLFATALVFTGAIACDAQQPDTAGSDYRATVASLEAKVAANSGDVEARRGLVRAMLELGRYDDADRVAAAGGPALARLRGIAQHARGRRTDAAASFQQALAGRASDSVSARLELALLQLEHGDRGGLQALEWFIPFYNNAERLTAEEFTAVGRAVATLGVTDPQLFKDAIKAFEDAVAADPKAVDARIHEASVFLDKFDSQNGTPVITDALAIEPSNPRALVQLARAQRFDGNSEAVRQVDRALAVNPNLVSARVLKAELLFASEDYSGAKAEAERALAVDSAAVEAIAVRAAVAYLAGDGGAYQADRRRALATNPRDTKFLTVVSQLIGNERRYIESITLAKEAIALDSTAWSAMTLAGMGEFRLGRFDAAKEILTTAFRGDPYNPWVKNTLDLLDKYPQFETVQSPHIELLLNRSESDLIALYMRPLAEAAYDTFAARYRWKPDGRIRIEVYPRHGDFSVRTVGLAGLGALGVSFGDILAMDSPAARQTGEFHWASTLWHEIAHTFTLGLSRMKLPRWLTEGASGWEESRKGWGDPITPSFIMAYAEGKLPPLSGITPAFIRPSYPEQVMHAYAMAQLVVEHIANTRGNDAVRRMVAGFANSKSQTDVFRDVLKVTPAEYDREFDTYMRKRFATQIAAVQGGPNSPYATALGRGRALLDAGSIDEAAKELERAASLFPEFGGPGSPYALMAQAELKRGNKTAAINWFDRVTQRYAEDYEAWVTLARLRDEVGDKKAAAAALEQAMFVHPYDPVQHDRLAVLYAGLGRHQEAVRERRAIVALKPVDRAAAFYNLALALEAAKDLAGAKSEVLKALEIAPAYPAAQELLLRLQAR